jgi:hemolysin activation/secretion protein
MTYIYRRKRTERMSATLDLSLKSAESRVIDTLDALDKLTVLSAQALYQGTSWSRAGAYQQLSATLSLGLDEFLGAMDSNGDGLSGRTGGSGLRAGGGFTKINIDYYYLRRIAVLQSLAFKLSLQQSSDLLTSLEQLALGGPDTVRAYPVAEALVDNAFLISLEWRADASPDIPQAFFNGLQYLAFFDFAEGSLNDPLNNEIESVTLYGIGVGAELRPFKKFRMKLQLAYALGDEPSDNQSTQFYFSFVYDY